MTVDDYPEDLVFVWRQNWKFFSFFADMQTQWRMGMSGATGLDYNVLPMLFRMHNVSRKDQPEYFECLRVMENEALGVMHSKE